MKENKIWGETTKVWSKNNTEIHRINIKKGGYCSKHLHQTKYNMFYVDSGKLLIEIWRNNDLLDKSKWDDEAMVDKTILTAGESTVVAPEQYHRFTALKATKALEIYWVDLKENDIIREDCGGVLKEK